MQHLSSGVWTQALAAVWKLRLGLLRGVCLSRQVFLAIGVREEDHPLLQLIYMLKEIYVLHWFTQHIMWEKCSLLGTERGRRGLVVGVEGENELVGECLCVSIWVAWLLFLHHSLDEGSCCLWGRWEKTEASEWSNSVKFSELTKLVFSLWPCLLSLAHPLQRCFLKVISVATVFAEAGVSVSGCTGTPFMFSEELDRHQRMKC